MNLPSLEKTEKAVLSVLINRLDGWDDEVVDSEMFHNPAHSRIFQILEKEPSVISIEIFVEKLMKAGELESLGGPAFISEIFTFVQDRLEFSQNVERLRVYSARRMAILAGRQIIDQAEDETGEFLGALGEPITKVLERATSSKTEQDKKGIIKGIIEEFKGYLEGKSTPMGWSVSLPTLSKALRGFTTPRYLVLSAYPSGGKTLLAVQFLIDFARQEVPSLMLSFEMPTDQIMKRAIVTAGKFSPELLYDPLSHALKRNSGSVSKEDLKRVREATREISSLPIHFEESIAPQIGQVITIIRRAVKRHGVKVVAIDYLQLIKDSSAKGNREQEISNISHALQAICKELKILVIVLSQQNQDGGTKYATTTTEDVDYHLSIAQVMDKESEDFKKVTGLWINKDRHTDRSGFKIPMEKAPDGLFFREIDYRDE